MEILKPSPRALKKAVEALEAGNVIICPTDTVYGFLADARNEKATEKIFTIKQRPRSKTLPLFVKDIKMAGQLAEIDARQARILKKFWPGKYTFVLKRKKIDIGRLSNSLKLYGVDRKTIAIRIPKNAFLGRLLKKMNCPLAQTSANISGQEPLGKAKDIISIFSSHPSVSLIINGGNFPKLNPSKIIDITRKTLTILR